MSNPELLAMLTAHGVDPFNIPGGDVPQLTALDVAAMMAKCSPSESALLRAKYCGEHPKSAWAYWFKYLMAQKWQTKKPGIVDALSMITLAEHISANRCGLCRGTQGWYVGAKYQVCPCCDGRGVVYFSNREIASRLGFENEGLKEPWLARLAWARKELIAWEARALANMRFSWNMD